MDDRFGLPGEDIDKLNSVFTRYSGIRKVVIYGSRAKGSYRNGSDIDLTIMGDMDWKTFNRLNVEIDDLLLPYQIDLSLYEQIEDSQLKAHIERIGQVFYSKHQIP